MPSIFSHAIFAASVSKAFTPNPLPGSFWVLTAGCAVLPDADVIAFAFDIPYGSMLGHRGFTHSVAFAVLTGVTVGLFASRKPKAPGTGWLILYFTLVTLSHSLLDMLTNGGLGVALFAPVSGERYFLPWRPVEVSPIGMRFFSARGVEVVVSEIAWIWLPGLFILLGAWVFRKAKDKS
jgi:inner membrane protein